MKRRLRNYRKKSGSFDSGVSSSCNVELLHSSNTDIEVSDLRFRTEQDLRNYIKSDFKLNSAPYISLIDVVKSKPYCIASNVEESSDEDEEMESIEKKPCLSAEVYQLVDASNEDILDKCDIEMQDVDEKPLVLDEDFQLPDTVNEEKMDKSGIESFVSRLSLGIITFNAFHKEVNKMKKIEIWNRKVNYDLIEVTSDSDIFKEATSLEVIRSSPCSYKNAEITENNSGALFKPESPKLNKTGPITRIVHNTERFCKSESPKLPVTSLKTIISKNNERDTGAFFEPESGKLKTSPIERSIVTNTERFCKSESPKLPVTSLKTIISKNIERDTGAFSKPESAKLNKTSPRERIIVTNTERFCKSESPKFSVTSLKTIIPRNNERDTGAFFKPESPKLNETSPIERIVNNTERFCKSESSKLPVTSLKTITSKNNERDTGAFFKPESGKLKTSPIEGSIVTNTEKFCKYESSKHPVTSLKTVTSKNNESDTGAFFKPESPKLNETSPIKRIIGNNAERFCKYESCKLPETSLKTITSKKIECDTGAFFKPESPKLSETSPIKRIIGNNADRFCKSESFKLPVTSLKTIASKNNECDTRALFKPESPKINKTSPIKRSIGNKRFCKSEPSKFPVPSLKNNECDIKNLGDNSVNVFKVPNIVKPNCKSRNVDSFKKPAMNIVQSSSVNQHLRSRLDAFKTMKCALDETLSSDDTSSEEENDDCLSIFAASEFNDETPKQPEPIAIENDRFHDSINWDAIDDWDAPSTSSLVLLDLPTAENSPLNSSSSSPPVDADHEMEKSEEVKESDNESQNESIVANWLSESNKISALALMRKCCWFYRDCRRTKCDYYHHLPPDLENAIINSTIMELNEGVKWILKVKSIALINDAVPLFIKAFCIQQCEERLINLIQDILHSHVDKTPHIKMIIKALSSLEGYDFSKAINEVIFTHSRRNAALTDILLNIIVDEENFIIQHWDLILNVTKGKRVLDFGVVEDIIKASLKANKKDIYLKVCKDLLMKPFVKIDDIQHSLLLQLITQLNQSSLSHYSQVINNIINKSSNIQLYKAPNDFHQTTTTTPTQPSMIFNNRIPSISNDLSDADIIALNDAVLHKDVNSFICLLNRYIRNNFLANSFITHLILISRKKLKNVMHIHELLMNSIKKSANLKKFWCHVVLNLLPLYDKDSHYKAAAEIIILFPNNALSHCQCLYDEEPYRSNLKNTQEKMVFIIKLLVRANFLKDAFDWIVMEEFRFNDTSNHALYEYKIKNVTDFLNRLIKGDLKFCAGILHAFIYGPIQIPAHLDFWAIYNQFLINILNAKNKMIIMHEIPVFEMFPKYICNSILRGFFMYLYQETDYPNLETVYHHLSENSIYRKQNVNGDIITLQNNYTIDEIFIVIRFFLINMLHHNKAPITLKILITQPSETTDENFIPNILKQNFSFEDRLMFATGKFVPPLVLNRNCTITANSVKLCLEQFRRHKPANSH